MLGSNYRLQAFNNTGAAVTITIKSKSVKFAGDGSLTFSTETTDLSATSVSSAAYQNGGAVDNSANKYLALQMSWTAAPGASVTGTVSLFIQRSTDGGTTWPTNGAGRLLSAINFVGSSTSVTKDAEAL